MDHFLANRYDGGFFGLQEKRRRDCDHSGCSEKSSAKIQTEGKC
jgi:hypothetical protein